MKKTAIIVGAAFFCLIASVSLNAQTPDTTSKQVPQMETPAVPEVQTQPTTPTTVPTVTAPETTVTTTSTVASKDRWNNWDKSKYAMLPMPEPLTTEKIFPAIGKYEVTTKDGATAQVTVTLDETNKGIVWIEGLPEGKIMGYLRQSPATYKLPVQKTDSEKDIASGVFIYDKDANTLNVCVNCKYNAEDPASAFLPADQQPVDETATVTKKSKKTAKTKKVVKAKPVFYSGTKVLEVAPATATTEPGLPSTTSIQQ